MSIAHIYGIRVVVGVSLLSAVIMMFIATYVLVARIEKLASSKFPASDVPSNISDPMKNTEYGSLLDSIDKQWSNRRSVFVSSSVVCILAGLLQSIFSGLVLLADTKSVRMYVQKWVTVHFILVFVLFVILINTVVLTENTADKTLWISSIEMLKKYLDNEDPSKDFSDLFRFFGVNQYLIYICVGVNMVVILAMMGSMLFMVKSLKDYEAY